jgi:uncharacterized beta-barrel protein YwiB (DUF1934 family)
MRYKSLINERRILMNNKVLISVKTTQYVDGQPETVELITEGQYRKDGDEYFAEYDETEISGMEGTKTTLKIEDNTFSIIRQGTTTSNLVFKKGIKHTSIYNTPFGSLEVIVNPSKLSIDANEDGCNVQLEYKMEAAGFDTIKNSLELNVKSLN